MKDINISFIIPVYNTENYIQKCITSIINNCPNNNFEIILVDDGSTDKSALICDNLSKSYKNIRTIHIKNSGVSNARNIGIRESKGKWISFIDSDDFIIENLNFIFQYLDNPEIELIHYGWIYTNDTINYYHVTDKTEILSYHHFFKRKIFHGYVWSYMFKKSIISKHNILFSCDMKYAEDWEFIFKYYSVINKNVVILKNNIYNQICRLGSATNQTLGEKYINDNFKMYNSVLSINKSKELNKCIKFHLYCINIWMVNNVIFCNYKNLVKIYSQNIRRFLNKKCFIFILSPIIFFPILSKDKHIYSLLTKLFYKMNI